MVLLEDFPSGFWKKMGMYGSSWMPLWCSKIYLGEGSSSDHQEEPVWTVISSQTSFLCAAITLTNLLHLPKNLQKQTHDPFSIVYIAHSDTRVALQGMCSWHISLLTSAKNGYNRPDNCYTFYDHNIFQWLFRSG